MTVVKYRGNQGSNVPNTGRGFSPNVWADINIRGLLDHTVDGVFYEDNFVKAPVLVTPTITTQALYGNGLKAFGSSGGTVISAGLEGGGGLILTESDDNEGFGISTIALPFKVIRGNGRFAAEARLKTNTIANTEHGFLFGLLDSATLSATVPIAANGTLADENLAGFHRLEGDGDQLDAVYKADGVTQVTVQADAISGGIAADTFFKVGLTYDPTSFLFSYLYNGVTVASYTVPAAAGTDFPNDVQMGLTLAGLCASNNDAIITLDWWAAAQLW